MSSSTSETPADAADAALAPGQLVGEYQIEDVLGRGAFGTVFRAVHPVIGKLVAIKVLARRFSVDPEMVSRFVAEARAVNQIRHRNIIDIFSFGQLEDGRQYYVMEFLDGETLDARLDRQGRLPLGEALPILRALGRALDAAHAKGIAHRDLKAENVFLANDPDGGAAWPKLLDFGIAKLLAPEDGLAHRTRTGAPIGTPYYMSPEQCRGKDVDHRTDFYAFGVLAYVLLTGTFPFDGDDYMSILMKQIGEEPAPPSSHVPELPAEIDDVLAWLMRKDPAERPPDLRTAVRALEQAAERAGLAAAAPTSTWDVQTGPVRVPTTPAGAGRGGAAAVAAPSLAPEPATSARKRRLVTVLLAVGLVGAGVAGLALHHGGRQGAGGQGVTPTGPAAAAGRHAGPVAEAAAADPHARLPGSAAAAATGSAPAPAAAGSAAASPTAAGSAAASPPAAPSTVILTIDGPPEGTSVMIAGRVVGAAPGPVQLPRAASEVVLTFVADGYLPASKVVTPDRDARLRVTLKRKARAHVRKHAPGKDDIIDVFGDKR